MRGPDVRKEMHGTTTGESVRRAGQAQLPIRMSNSRFNATPRNVQAVGLPVDAIPPEGVKRCGIQDMKDHQFIIICQAFFFKCKSSLYI